MLAGWLLFCYWLYSTLIYPRLHPANPHETLIIDENQNLPLAYTWGSEIPIAGKGWDALASKLNSIATGNNILVMRTYYFPDEALSAGAGKELAMKRMDHVLTSLGIKKHRILPEYRPREIYADVKSIPFEALDYEEIPVGALVRITGDTAEICFPLRDSLIVPVQLYESLDPWINAHEEAKMATTYLVGIADGTGIAESSEMASERAMLIRNYLVNKGWNEERLILSTGQRNESLPIRNRCVMIYYE